MFDNLSNNLQKAFQTLKGQGSITEINVATTVKEIRRALIDADVNFKVAKEITDEIKTKALGQNVLTSVSPGQLLTKITNDELTKLMGSQHKEIDFSGNPSIILIAGLQGSGKTTFSGKLANMIKKQGKKTMLVACDVYRPAAIDQLKILGDNIEVEVYSEPENKNVLQIAKNALETARNNGTKVMIFDTAGRLAVDEVMMKEISSLKNTLNPSETLFVVDAMTGQDAVNTAKTFDEMLDFSGVVLSKMDGDTRGGAALSIRRVVNKPIKFVSLGEKMDAIDKFHPDRIASRILGMGDVVTFVEKAQATFDEEESKKLNRKLRKNQFDLNDFLTQIDQIKKMGNIKDLIGMIPGMGKAIKGANIDENSFKYIKAIIQSMTKEERVKPEIINGDRRKRIASGSGTSIQQVNNLLKQFGDMRKTIKMMNKMSEKKGGFNLLNQMGKG